MPNAVLCGTEEAENTQARILIADDHELFRRGLRSLLESCPDWDVCGEAADGLDCLVKTKALKPSLVIVDMTMPGLDGLEVTRRIRREVPETDVLMLSQYAPSQMRSAALDAGARAFVSKTDAATELLSAIESIFGDGHDPAA